jgi:outer membrane lipoprotein-sorting protein
MRYIQRRTIVAFALTLALAAGGLSRLTALRPAEARDIREFVTPLKDLETTVKVTKIDSKELKKIGGDFATNYAVFRNLRTLSLLYKSPNKILLEGKSSLLGEAVLIINGPQRFFAAPKIGQRKHENLEKEPVRRQSLLEYGGLLSADTLGFMRAKFVHEETLNSTPTLIYDLTYQNGSASYYRLWIDPKTRLIRKRAWYDGENRLRATFCYEDVKEVAEGVYLPGRCDILNADGTTAGSMTYTGAKINQGVSDTLFDLTQ